MMLRGSLSIGWDSNMASPIKALAEAEGLLVDWLFENAQDFLKQVITIMMDEPSTR